MVPTPTPGLVERGESPGQQGRRGHSRGCDGPHDPCTHRQAAHPQLGPVQGRIEKGQERRQGGATVGAIGVEKRPGVVQVNHAGCSRQ